MKEWYNSTLPKRKMNLFISKNDTEDIRSLEVIAKTGNLKEFRMLCNFLSTISYTGIKIDHEVKTKLVKLCNERVSSELGELTSIFNELRISQRHEYWAGDERYKLFGFDFPSYADRQVIKSALTLLVKYMDKPLLSKDLKIVSHLYNSGLYWDLVKEHTTDVDWENNENEFNRLNNVRKKHIESWIRFMNLVWNKKYEDAYVLMCVLAKRDNARHGWDYV